MVGIPAAISKGPQRNMGRCGPPKKVGRRVGKFFLTSRKGDAPTSRFNTLARAPNYYPRLLAVNKCLIHDTGATVTKKRPAQLPTFSL